MSFIEHSRGKVKHGMTSEEAPFFFLLNQLKLSWKIEISVSFS